LVIDIHESYLIHESEIESIVYDLSNNQN